MKRTLLGLSAFALAACGGGGGTYEEAMPSPAPMTAKSERMQIMSADDAVSEGLVNNPSPNVGEPAVEQYIAYSHNLGLSLPKGQVEPLMQAHTEACRTAGTANCIVINSNIWSQDEDNASGSLSLRATPDWIDGFMGSVASDTDKLGGEITQRSTNAQDLTREILDTGARLDAQRTLQGRLMGLLERRDGSLGDLLQIERELARVTGDIESIEAQLKTLRLRVSMSSLDMNYQTKQPAFSATRNSPLGEAFGDFFYNLSGAIAAVITAFAIGLPWIILLGLFLWIWLKLIWPRLRRKPKT